MKRFIALTLAIVFIGGTMLLAMGSLYTAGAQQTQPAPQQGTGEIKNPPAPPAPGTDPAAPPQDPSAPNPDKEKQREYETQC